MLNDYDDFEAEMHIALDMEFESCLYLSEQLDDPKARHYYREEARKVWKKILERDRVASFA
jgi:hypothetical protein